MKPLIKNCTENVQTILRDAEKFSYVQEFQGITGDDIILSTFFNAENFEHSDAFFSILGIKEKSHITAYINYLYQKIENTNFEELGIGNGKILFDKKFEKKFKNLKNQKGEKWDLLSILDVGFSSISSELKQVLKLDHINYNAIRTSIQDLSKSPVIQEEHGWS